MRCSTDRRPAATRRPGDHGSPYGVPLLRTEAGFVGTGIEGRVARDSKTVVVAEGSDNPALYKKEIKLADVQWIMKSMGPRQSLSRAATRDEDDGRHKNGGPSVFARVMAAFSVSSS